MKILPIDNCGDCPHYRWIDVNYSLECGLTCEQIRYKEIGANKALIKLFNQCPLQEYSINEIKLLSAFLVERGLAEDYIRWKEMMGKKQECWCWGCKYQFDCQRCYKIHHIGGIDE